MSQEIIDRFKAISNIRLVLDSQNLLIANPGVELKRIIEEEDVEFLEQLEAWSAEVAETTAKKEQQEARKAQGRLIRETANELLDTITGFNLERELTVEQLNFMEGIYAPILQAISIGRIFKAKPLIEAIEVNDLFITQEMKDEILQVYVDAGF